MPIRCASNPIACEAGTASPLVFTASLPKQKHSRAKSRQLRRLPIQQVRGVYADDQLCDSEKASSKAHRQCAPYNYTN